MNDGSTGLHVICMHGICSAGMDVIERKGSQGRNLILACLSRRVSAISPPPLGSDSVAYADVSGGVYELKWRM
jgi:hypothetical protein